MSAAVADLDGATATRQFWEDYLVANPEALYRILADLYALQAGSDARPASLEELWGLVTPSFAVEPFGPALLDALGNRSQRWLAGRINLSQMQLNRLVRGERPVIMLHDVEGSMRRLEDIAAALRIHPSYFCEWRRLWALRLVDAAFAAQPNLSISFFRKFSRLADPADRGPGQPARQGRRATRAHQTRAHQNGR